MYFYVHVQFDDSSRSRQLIKHAGIQNHNALLGPSTQSAEMLTSQETASPDNSSTADDISRDSPEKRGQGRTSDGDPLKESQVKRYESDMSDASSNGCCSCPYIPRRYIVVFLSTLGMMVVYCMRTNVGVTMITILDEEAHMKVGTPEAKWNVRL